MAKRGKRPKNCREVYEEIPRHLLRALEALWRFEQRPNDSFRDLREATSQLSQAAGDAGRWAVMTGAAKPPDMRRGRPEKWYVAWDYGSEAESRARAALAAWASDDAGRCAQMCRQAYAWAFKARKAEAWWSLHQKHIRSAEGTSGDSAQASA